ncbi:hypothetical protein GCK32_005519 [Trichostrongylus colubriformis]|uniref:Uncharacterized protein n=1 Tax=Trichostrongylus colubriformis TaxID=6319 RepID=A0AAN8FTH4_TRICO
MRLLVLPEHGWPSGEAFYNLLLMLPTIILVVYIMYWFYLYKCCPKPQGEPMLVTPVVDTPQGALSAPPTYSYSSQGVSHEQGIAEYESSGEYGHVKQSTSSRDTKSRSKESAEPGFASV